eukprot:CAMPEP_0175081466 /NCGR_PEP_ID=MMETSP0052_2-20121109/26166_1 /TAXON_ID=51329 ORGANISM="Polytomella parva, Strain SAG 63-3" /NCGR_SAMPLE_ID=MMETSP0052_2 /ASSEMBLY_ACC=CAM_ASM_000194 /LENGTH=702 /DNA_ID=CAMNT_0016352455 /DNA_START=311 /DNA_END=2419 /DNA_ORIENTATION=-
MKTIAAVAIASSSTVTLDEVLLAGIFVSTCILFLGVTRLTDLVNWIIPRSVVRGLQLAVGFNLAKKGMLMALKTKVTSSNPLTGATSTITTWRPWLGPDPLLAAAIALPFAIFFSIDAFSIDGDTSSLEEAQNSSRTPNRLGDDGVISISPSLTLGPTWWDQRPRDTILEPVFQACSYLYGLLFVRKTRCKDVVRSRSRDEGDRSCEVCHLRHVADPESHDLVLGNRNHNFAVDDGKDNRDDDDDNDDDDDDNDNDDGKYPLHNSTLVTACTSTTDHLPNHRTPLSTIGPTAHPRNPKPFSDPDSSSSLDPVFSTPKDAASWWSRWRRSARSSLSDPEAKEGTEKRSLLGEREGRVRETEGEDDLNGGNNSPKRNDLAIPFPSHASMKLVGPDEDTKGLVCCGADVGDSLSRVVTANLGQGAAGTANGYTWLSRVPHALIFVVAGVVMAAVNSPDAIKALRLGPSMPHLLHPSWTSLKRAAWEAGLPQLPLTLLNSVIAVSALASSLFPEKDPKSWGPSIVATCVGSLNLIGCWIGAMPCCHGSGGLAAQYKFGSRSGVAPIILGVGKITLGLLFGSSLFGLLKAFPQTILGSMLVIAGTELASSIRFQRGSRDWIVLMLTAVSVVSLEDTGAGFCLGLVAATVAACKTGAVRLLSIKKLNKIQKGVVGRGGDDKEDGEKQGLLLPVSMVIGSEDERRGELQ